nr:MAG TPA: hypothetical protein [Caudoviricetes sp.]
MAGFFFKSVLNDDAVVLLLVKGERRSPLGRRQTDDSHTDT